MANLNTNNTISTSAIRRLADGGSVCLWVGEVTDLDAKEFMYRKAREIRMANPDLHIRLDVDWYPEDVPCAWDPDDWVLSVEGEIWASR